MTRWTKKTREQHLEYISKTNQSSSKPSHSSLVDYHSIIEGNNLSQLGTSTRSQKSSNLLDSDDFLNLNGQIRSQQNLDQLTQPFRVNQKIPRHEYYNQQRVLVKQLNKQPEMLTDQLTPFSMLLNQDNLNQSLFQNQQFIDQIFGLNNRQTNSNQESNQNIDCRYFN